jgi:hypothetical protein
MVALLGAPIAACALGWDRTTLNDRVPANGVALLRGTVKRFAAVSLTAHSRVPLDAWYTAPATALPSLVAYCTLAVPLAVPERVTSTVTPPAPCATAKVAADNASVVVPGAGVGVITGGVTAEGVTGEAGVVDEETGFEVARAAPRVDVAEPAGVAAGVADAAATLAMPAFWLESPKQPANANMHVSISGNPRCTGDTRNNIPGIFSFMCASARCACAHFIPRPARVQLSLNWHVVSRRHVTYVTEPRADPERRRVRRVAAGVAILLDIE